MTSFTIDENIIFFNMFLKDGDITFNLLNKDTNFKKKFKNKI